MQMPICKFCKQRFVDVGDDADDECPLCPACTTAAGLLGDDIKQHSYLRGIRQLSDDELTRVVQKDLAKRANSQYPDAFRPVAVSRVADLRFCDNQILNHNADDVYWNTDKNGEINAHTFPCKHFGRGKGEFSRDRLGYECDSCGDLLYALKSAAKKNAK